MSIEEQIQQLNESALFIKFFETGAGVPTSSLIMDYSGASKTIHSVESLYSKESFDERFYTDERFVSVERLKLILESEEVSNSILQEKYNTCFASTFQVGNDISTHGWIGIRSYNNIYYYHVSIHNNKTRKEYINEIGIIGLKLLTNLIGIENKDYQVDTIMGCGLDYNHEATLEFIAKNKDTESGAIFKSDNSICRVEDIFRKTKKLVIYKGSFNFIHNQHIDIMEDNIDEESKGLFCISINTYQKQTNNLLKRIEYINSLGYDVLVLSKPFYVNTIEFIRHKFKGEILFPMGKDTLTRLLEDYKNVEFNNKDNQGHCVYDIDKIKLNFNHCKIISYPRINTDTINIDCDIIIQKTNIISDISSTSMRKFIEEKNYQELKKIIPLTLYNKIINEI